MLGDPERTAGEVVEITNPVLGTHRKLVVRDGVIVGATLVGDLSRIGLITQHYDRGRVLGPAEPGALLLGDRPARPAATARRRRGLRVRRRRPPGAIRACSSLDQVRETTRATTGCGGCARPSASSSPPVRPTLEGTRS